MSENNGKKDPSIIDLLKSLNSRISALEQKMQNSNPRPFYQSSKQPSHYLEASSKLMTDAGLNVESTIPVCSTCHSLLGEKYSICHHDDQVICQNCTIIHNNRAHCEQCLRENHLDLTKRDYLVLMCLVNGITEPEVINELTTMQPEDIDHSLANLRLFNLIDLRTSFFGFLRETKLTDDGLVAINTYRQIYGKHEDVTEFGRALRKYLTEESE